jgi:drug/metabolite transporter (DMT)-like permease
MRSERAATPPAGRPSVPLAHLVFALALVYVLWGSTYLAMRIAVATIPPFTMAAMRHLTAGALLYTFLRLRGTPAPRPVHWRSTAIIGALLLLLGNGGVAWAEQRVGSGMSALLICSEPMWVVLFVWLRRGGQRPSPRVVTGLLVGFAGLLLLVRPNGTGLAVDKMGAAALLLASIAWAAGSLYVQRATLPESPWLTTAMQMLCGGAMLVVASVVSGEPARFAVSHVATGSVLAVVYLIIFGSLIGFTAYTWLLRSASPVLVATYAYVNPVVAVLLGWAFVHEAVTPAMLAGALVILAGVALITTATARREPPASQQTPASTQLSVSPHPSLKLPATAMPELVEDLEIETCA